MRNKPRPDLRTGLLAGAVGGLAVHYAFGACVAMFYGAAIEVARIWCMELS